MSLSLKDMKKDHERIKSHLERIDAELKKLEEQKQLKGKPDPKRTGKLSN